MNHCSFVQCRLRQCVDRYGNGWQGIRHHHFFRRLRSLIRTLPHRNPPCWPRNSLHVGPSGVDDCTLHGGTSRKSLVSVCLSVWVSLSLSLLSLLSLILSFISFSSSLPSLPLSVSLSLYVSLCLALSLSLFPSLSLCLSLSAVSLRFSLPTGWICTGPCVSLSLSPSVCLSVCLSLYLSLSLSRYFFCPFSVCVWFLLNRTPRVSLVISPFVSSVSCQYLP